MLKEFPRSLIFLKSTVKGSGQRKRQESGWQRRVGTQRFILTSIIKDGGGYPDKLKVNTERPLFFYYKKKCLCFQMLINWQQMRCSYWVTWCPSCLDAWLHRGDTRGSPRMTKWETTEIWDMRNVGFFLLKKKRKKSKDISISKMMG